jgi:cardiolipin synthase
LAAANHQLFHADTVGAPMQVSSMARFLVCTLTLSRLLGGILVSVPAVHNHAIALIFLICFALLSDLVDGWLARFFRVETVIGHVLDLLADKTLILSVLLFAASRGIELLPLTIIACRELVTLGMRAVPIQGGGLLPTSRTFGATIMIAVCGLAICLTVTDGEHFLFLEDVTYWIIAVVVVANTAARLWTAAPGLRQATNLGS